MLTAREAAEKGNTPYGPSGLSFGCLVERHGRKVAGGNSRL